MLEFEELPSLTIADMQPKRDEICALVREINNAWKASQADRLVEFFHEDMVIVGPGYQEMGRGRAACVESYRAFASQAKVHEYTESDFKTFIWGNTAVCTYSWAMTYEQSGQRSRETGTDQFVFSREEGKWLAVWRYLQFEPATV